MKSVQFYHSLPFNPISKFYKDTFGEKVYKIPVSLADDCPNRLGLKGMQTCVFCDEWGSAAKKESFDLDLKTQIEKYKADIGRKKNANKFLVYFQAYTSTFKKFTEIEKAFELALSYDDILGIVVGTRPDCLSQSLFDLWSKTLEKKYLTVEFGIQSFFDPHLDFLRRGHTRAQSIEGILRLKKHVPVDIGIHLIFGIPNETDQQIIETAELVNSLPIHNVKLHNLHVLKNTPLADMHNKGKFTPIDRDLYFHRVQIFLEHLRSDVYVHRLAAYAPRWDELIAPAWTADKMNTYQSLIDSLNEKKSCQSLRYQDV